MAAWVDDSNLSLFVDLYELTMLQAYWREGRDEMGVFQLFMRRLPSQRNFLIAAGLDDFLSYLECLRFDSSSLEYLDSLGLFSPEFLDQLSRFRFQGDVRAVPEGSIVFADEPIIEVAAPLGQAQIVETFALNQIHFQTLAASKAARVVLAAAGRPVADFGMRRAHGADAAMKAARAMRMAGVDSTSNLLAGRSYGIPVGGTMAHSFIQSHCDEVEAFESFNALYPGTVVLIDTYDTLRAARRLASMANRLGEGFKVRAVRLDSGDLDELSKQVRRILDQAGLAQVGIVASSSLDENGIARLVASGAPIDGFGVGTRMMTSADAPTIDCAYKLVEYRGEGCVKLSQDKPSWPGRKQVWRLESEGRAFKDVISLQDERLQGRPLLSPVMRQGRRLAAGRESLERMRERVRRELDRLPQRLLKLDPAHPPYPVEFSPRLRLQREELAKRLKPDPASQPGP